MAPLDPPMGRNLVPKIPTPLPEGTWYQRYLPPLYVRGFRPVLIVQPSSGVPTYDFAKFSLKPHENERI